MSQPDDHSRAYLLFDPAELQYDFGEGHPLQRSQVIGSHWSYAPVRIAIPPPMAPRPMNASITTSAIRILCKQKLRDTLLPYYASGTGSRYEENHYVTCL